MSKPLTTLIIMDGYGCAKPDKFNAVTKAKRPNLDKLFDKYPHTTINCFGPYVGLPKGQMGNSEVGHLNLGAGRIIYQPLTRITKAIEDGEFFENPALVSAMENAVKNNSALHLLGLVSDGGVHSHQDHLLACVEMAKSFGIKDVFVHCFMDGRDVPPTSGLGFIKDLEQALNKIGLGKIATIAGRFYAMDRDNIWERVSLAYSAIADGEGVAAQSPEEAMQQSYDKGENDEFVKPTVVLENGKPTGVVHDKDSVIFFNFRPDRARQLTNSFINKDFDGFERKKGCLDLCFVTMTVYDATFDIPAAFKPQSYENTLGEYLAKNGKKQLRIAETQKYAHVTYFFNGGEETPNEGEDRILVPSPKIATFDMKPEMSAYEVTEAVLKEIEAEKYDVIIMNYANCDMVGHTGILQAAVDAVETIDTCVGRVVEAIRAKGGKIIITADHGNAEQMWDYEKNVPYTAHTVSNPVPLIIIDDNRDDIELYDDGKLADVAPTLLTMMGLEIPKEMTGKSLIK
ncbi:MAG: 2,3-bisphosphoglycerate-independent phosphoglycerate mutase [Clostridia bacterium]|nr:2,3-bisphosphoglycerate-independent phosphoglycerate mutase [Clostridia bacterium]